MFECWTDNLLKLEHLLSSVFRAWGVFVARHPLLVIIVSTIFAGVFSFFIAFMEEETDSIKLFSPEGTQSRKNLDRYRSTWAEYQPTERNNWMIVTGKNGNDNLYTADNLYKGLQIHEYLMNNVTVTDGDDIIRFQDICSLIYSNNDNCYILSALEFFDFNKTLIDQILANTNVDDTSSLDPTKIVNNPIQFSPWSQEYETLLLRFGSPIASFPFNVSDGMQKYQFNVVSGTPAYQFTFVTDGDNYEVELLEEWEDKWMEALNEVTDKLGLSDEFDITYAAQKSFDDELTRAIASDISSFIITFVILSTLGTIFVLRFRKNTWGPNGRCKYEVDPTRSRSLVANFGVLSAVLSIGACFGLTGGILGVKFNGVASISPFLLLGLGVDDMFVLLRSYELTSPLLSVEERIALTMERGGVSIMFTSITDLVAFSIGSTSVFGAVSAFCAFCAVGVLFDFLFQVTFFLGFMVYDSRWNASVGDDFRWPNCLCCCCKNPRTCGSLKSDAGPSAGTGTGGDVELAAKKRSTSGGTASAQSVASASTSVIGHLIDDQASSVAMEKLGELILSSRLVSFGILAIFAAYVAVGIYGITTLISYEDPVDLAPNDSYLKAFYADAEDYFNEVGPPMMFGFDKELDYSDPEVQTLVSSFVAEVEEYKCFGSPDLTQNWVTSYESYLETNNVTVDNTTHWYYLLYSEYLNTEEGSVFIDDIWQTTILDNVQHTYDVTVDGLSYIPVYDNVTGQTNHLITVDYEEFSQNIGTSITRSRVWIQMVAVGYGAEVLATCLNFLKDVTADYKDTLGSYYFLEEMVFAETNEVAVEQTIFNVSLASAAAFLICLILIPYPSVSIFVAYAVGQILVGVLGYMSLWDITINTTSMINIVISVGFSVDNTAHFCHAYMIAPITTVESARMERQQRVLFALNSVGVPILAGDISTVLALLPLAAAESAIFVSFFKILFLVMLFGAAHAILFLPVLFSLIGPINVHNPDAQHTDTANGHGKNDTVAAEKKEPLNNEKFAE